MKVLFSEDDSELRAGFPKEDYRDFLSVYRGGDYIPIEFDHLDYIECIDCAKGGKYRAVSHPVIIQFGEEDLQGADQDVDILFSEDEKKFTTYSSIDQYRKYIATYERGGWTPIEFDYLDYIECVGCEGKDRLRPVSHPVIIEFDDKIGYHFPIGEYEYTTDDYMKFDRDEVILLPLPEFYGEGFYQRREQGEVIPNFDDGSGLGTRNNIRLRIGMGYVLANEFLPADDPEE